MPGPLLLTLIISEKEQILLCDRSMLGSFDGFCILWPYLFKFLAAPLMIITVMLHL